jgi:hypothetical protein
MEGFAATPTTMINVLTECPTGTKMYMYEGKAYCCDSTINPDADTVRQSCRKPIYPPDAPYTFCTLGADEAGVPNCLKSRIEVMQRLGMGVCPPSHPNFCKGAAGSPTENGRCCVGPTNEALTDCVDPAPSKQCNVTTSPNIFTDHMSCQFLRAKETDVACPAKFGQFTAPGQGALSDIAVYGCTDMKQSCYSATLIAQLKALGKDVSGLVDCATITQTV